MQRRSFLIALLGSLSLAGWTAQPGENLAGVWTGEGFFVELRGGPQTYQVSWNTDRGNVYTGTAAPGAGSLELHLTRSSDGYKCSFWMSCTAAQMSGKLPSGRNLRLTRA